MITPLPGVRKFLNLKPEIEAIIRGRGEGLEQYDPAPCLADVVRYYEAKEALESGLDTFGRLKETLQELEMNPRTRAFIDHAFFFERTYLSDNMDLIISKMFALLMGRREVRTRVGLVRADKRILILPSLMGGGKTHTEIVVIHIIKAYNEAVRKGDRNSFKDFVAKLDEDLADRLINIATFERPVKLVAIDCGSSELAPDLKHPRKVIIKTNEGLRAYEVKSLWGSLAYYLDKYEEFSHLDDPVRAPTREELEKLLKGDPTLIIIDEPDRYGERVEETKLVGFFQSLAEAVDRLNNVVLVISLKVEPGVRAEGLVGKIDDVLRRKDHEYLRPLKPGDLPQVLRRRLLANDVRDLEDMGRKVAKLMLSRGGSALKGAIDSLKMDLVEELGRCYPFHPLTIRLLEAYSERLLYLQRTRDAIRLMVAALSAIFNDDFRWISEDFYVIGPYHIPIHDRYEPIRLEIINPKADDVGLLQRWYKDDVEKGPRRAEDEGIEKLARLVAIYIWLKSVIGRGLTSPEVMRYYPTRSEITAALSDPAIYGDKRISDLEEAIRVIHENPEGHVVNVDGRYFMISVMPLEELVKRMVELVSPNEVLEELERIIAEMFKGEDRARRRRAKSVKEGARVFKKDYVHVVTRENREDIPDCISRSEEPVLVVFTFEPDEEDLDKFLVRNNVVVFLPDLECEIAGKKAKDLLEYDLRRIVALEKKISDDVLERYYSPTKYGGEILGEMRRKRESMTREHVEHVRQVLRHVYGKLVIGRQRRSEDIKLARFVSAVGERPLIRVIEDILSDRGLMPEDNKLHRTDILLIAESMGRTSVIEDIKEPRLEREVEIRSLWEHLMTSVKPPFSSTVIDFNGFLNGIKEMYERLEVAFRFGDRVIWKKIWHERPHECRDKGDWGFVEKRSRELGVSDVKDLEIVPWESIIDDFIKELQKKAGLKEDNGIKKKVEVMASFMNPLGEREDIKLDDLLRRPAWKNILRDARVWLHEEEVPYAFVLEIVEPKMSVECDPEEPIKVTIKIDARDYPYPVKVTVTIEKAKRTSHTNPDSSQSQEVPKGTSRTLVFEIKAPPEPGEYVIRVRAVGKGDPKEVSDASEISLIVRGEVPEEIEIPACRLKELLESDFSDIELVEVTVDKSIELDGIIQFISAREIATKFSKAELNKMLLKRRVSDEKVAILRLSGEFPDLDSVRRAFGPLLKWGEQIEEIKLSIEISNLRGLDDVKKAADIFERYDVKTSILKLKVYRRVGGSQP